MLTPDFRFPTALRLKRRKDLQALFQGSGHLFAFPLRVHFQLLQEQRNVPVQVAFSVSKRKFRHAVDRNRVRRRIREAWRLQWHPLGQRLGDQGLHLHVMFIYTGGEQDTTYAAIAKGVKKAIHRLSAQLPPSPPL